MNKIETQCVWVRLGVIITNTNMINICIPKVNKECLNKGLIHNAFSRIGLGVIKTITIHGNGCVFVIFSKWFDTERTRDIQKKLLDGENIYVTYDQEWGWFWKCCMLRSAMANC